MTFADEMIVRIVAVKRLWQEKVHADRPLSF
jgi:hypothetical protein